MGRSWVVSILYSPRLASPNTMRTLPLWLKLSFTLWMMIWVPAIFLERGAENFLWFCDVANFLLLVAVWAESSLLISSQAVGVLLIQLCWAFDFFVRCVAGFHPLGATAYMFDPTRPIYLRGLSLFHLVVPVLLVWLLVRLGYHRRGWVLQVGIAWLVLPMSYLLTNPERNINWLWRPFGIEQVWVSPGLYFWVCMLAYPVILYLPSHFLLRRWARRSKRVRLVG